MSTADVAIVERFLATLQAGDLPGLRSVFSEDLVIEQAAGLPWGGEYHGPDCFEKIVRGIAQDYRAVLTDTRAFDAGGFVVGLMDVNLTSRATGERLTVPVVELYEIEDGLIRRIAPFYKDTKAVSDMHARASGEVR